MIDKVLIVAKGAAMGAADVVPGVSGGTIALLTGIYPRLINAITGLNLVSLQSLLKGNIQEFWKAIDGHFILPLLIGIALAFILLAHPIKYAIANHPIPTWSFFFGLIIAAAILIIQHIPHKKKSNYLWLIPGIAFGLWVGSLSSIPFPSNQIAVFTAGMIAICAMILPGISGSFILVLLGMYETLLTAVRDFQWGIIFTFIAGAVVGLLVFSRVLKWILAKYYKRTLIFLSGLMLGSLVKVWPWKIEHQGTISNVLPTDYQQQQLFWAVTMMITAFVVVFLVDFLGRKFSTTNK